MRTMIAGTALSLALMGCSTAEPSASIQRNGDLVIGTVSSGISDEELEQNASGVLCAPEETVSDLFINRNDDGSARVSARCVG